MKERLIQLLDLEQLSPSKFADIIGVQRSSVSHVISERNKPSYDFLVKTLKAFPGLNAGWLLLGQGTMYEQMGRDVPGNLFDGPPEVVDTSFPGDIHDGDPYVGEIGDILHTTAEPEKPGEPDPAQLEIDDEHDMREDLDKSTRRQVVQVMIFYGDDTFKSFSPSN